MFVCLSARRIYLDLLASSKGSSSKSSKYGGRGGSGFWSSKSEKHSTIKKAVAIGAVAYGSYKVGKLSKKFSNFGWGNTYQPTYGFTAWNTWRQADGFLCRNDNDCTWLDEKLYCNPNVTGRINVRFSFLL